MAASTLAACTLLTSLDELYGGSPDAGTQLPSEAGVPETGGEASPPDAAIGDADAEAAVPFCKSITGFAICADFDDNNSPPFPFDSVSLNGASNTLTYDSVDSKSPPRSLFMTGGPSSSGNTATGLVWKAPATTVASEIVAELDFRAEQRGSRPFDLLQFGRAGYDLSIEIAASGSLQFDYQIPDGDGGSLNGTAPTTATATGAWQHVKWTAKKDTGTRFKIDVSVDGVPAGSTTINQTLYTGQATVDIGDTSLEVSTTLWKVRMDNIVITVK